MGYRAFYGGGIALLFFCVFFLFEANAQAPIGLTVQPIKISHTLVPGGTTSGVIRISNASEETVQVEAKVEDFIPVAGSETLQFVGRAPGITTVRDWISLLSESTFELARGETRNISYTITAPAVADPGGHFGVLFFKATRIGDTAQLKVGTQVGVLTFVTIPGNRLQKGTILGFSAPKFVDGNVVPFQIKFENTGTVHFEPRGTITIKNIFGQIVAEVPVEGQVVLPTGVKEFVVTAEASRPFFGHYTAAIDIQDGEGNSITTKDLTYYAFPVWYVGAFVLLLLLTFFVIRFVRRKISFSVSLRK